jgi:hypothetical protein
MKLSSTRLTEFDVRALRFSQNYFFAELCPSHCIQDKTQQPLRKLAYSRSQLNGADPIQTAILCHRTTGPAPSVSPTLSLA